MLFAIGALLSAYATFEALSVNPAYEPPGTAATTFSMLGITLPLAWRRRYPLTAAVVVIAVFLIARMALDMPESSMTVLAGSLALYSAAVHGRSPLRVPVLIFCFLLVIGEVARELYLTETVYSDMALMQGFTLAYNAVILALPWILGTAIRSLKRRERELTERASELQREREENARRAVFEERVRIARELHDVVAHHVSVMGIQAGAARRVMTTQPDQAEAALSSIEAASRQAVLELHRLLGFLRREGETDDVAPQPGLGELDELVAQVNGAKLAVDLEVEGEPRPLPRTVEVSAYRIVQEALTNTIKHSGGTKASVRLRYEPSALELEVVDDGTGTPVTPRDPLGGGGHGLIGMRERVNLHGGHLRAAPRPDGGFGVHATFPLTGGTS